jgi:hypothetical protein
MAELPTRDEFLRTAFTPVAPSSLPEGQRVCQICQEDYINPSPGEEPERPVRLPCNHIFGEKCIKTHFNTADVDDFLNRNCPFRCRLIRRTVGDSVEPGHRTELRQQGITFDAQGERRYPQEFYNELDAEILRDAGIDPEEHRRERQEFLEWYGLFDRNGDPLPREQWHLRARGIDVGPARRLDRESENYGRRFPQEHPRASTITPRGARTRTIQPSALEDDIRACITDILLANRHRINEIESQLLRDSTQIRRRGDTDDYAASPTFERTSRRPSIARTRRGYGDESRFTSDLYHSAGTSSSHRTRLGRTDSQQPITRHEFFRRDHQSGANPSWEPIRFDDLHIGRHGSHRPSRLSERGAASPITSGSIFGLIFGRGPSTREPSTSNRLGENTGNSRRSIRDRIFELDDEFDF